MYQAERDPYCYPGNDVLKNRAGLQTAEALEAFETAMTFARSEEPLPLGRFSVRHYRAVHHHLFQDVYDWAGKFRTVRLAKDISSFCHPEHIARDMTTLFAWLRQQNHLRNRSPTDLARGGRAFPVGDQCDPSVPGGQRTNSTDLSRSARRSCRAPSRSRSARSGRDARRHDQELRG